MWFEVADVTDIVVEYCDLKDLLLACRRVSSLFRGSSHRRLRNRVIAVQHMEDTDVSISLFNLGDLTRVSTIVGDHQSHLSQELVATRTEELLREHYAETGERCVAVCGTSGWGEEVFRWKHFLHDYYSMTVNRCPVVVVPGQPVYCPRLGFSEDEVGACAGFVRRVLQRLVRSPVLVLPPPYAFVALGWGDDDDGAVAAATEFTGSALQTLSRTALPLSLVEAFRMTHLVSGSDTAAVRAAVMGEPTEFYTFTDCWTWEGRRSECTGSLNWPQNRASTTEPCDSFYRDTGDDAKLADHLPKWATSPGGEYLDPALTGHCELCPLGVDFAAAVEFAECELSMDQGGCALGIPIVATAEARIAHLRDADPQWASGLNPTLLASSCPEPVRVQVLVAKHISTPCWRHGLNAGEHLVFHCTTGQFEVSLTAVDWSKDRVVTAYLRSGQSLLVRSPPRLLRVEARLAHIGMYDQGTATATWFDACAAGCE
jgi:hypothetical protein